MTLEKLPYVAIVHPTLSWYRLPLFRQLSNLYPRVTVLFTQSYTLPIYSNKRIKVEKPKGFDSKLFPSYRIFPPPYPQEVSPHIIFELVKGRYDVIVWGDSLTSIEALFIFLISKVLKKPLILWIDEWGMPKPLLRRLIDPIVNFMLTQSSAIIAHGEKHYRYLRSKDIEENKIFISGSVSWITPTKEDYDIASILSKDFRGKKILYVGGLIERKGVQYLIEAFAKLVSEYNDLNLWIVGDGPLRSFLADLVRRLKIEKNVTFFGWIPHNKIAPYFLSADVFVLPSWNEPWGLVINEAMSVGKPIITTFGVGSCYDLVKNGVNGFIVREKSSSELYSALKKILSSEEMIKKMGESSLKIVADYTYERMARVFLRAVFFSLSRTFK